MFPKSCAQVVVSIAKGASGVIISVQDRGRGIAPEHLTKVFDSFFSTKRKGMGLGLSITRTIVEAHGGRVWAENGPRRGRGVSGRIALGCRERRAAAEPGMNTTPLIHVVDDDESMRTALLRLLGAAGFDALGYGSAGEFLLHPVPDRPGCLLLDLLLPGPSGLALQDALQRGGVNLPVVFLTGNADVPSTVRGMKAGAVDFLTKPVQRDILLDALRRALARDAEQRRSRNEAGRLRARFDSLTQREREVFDGIVAGKLNKQIAHELGIAERTIKRHRAQVMAKLGVDSAAGLGRLAELLQHSSEG